MMGKKFGFVFPGQGSQYVGMGKKLFDFSSELKEVFEKADEVLGIKLSEVCFNGPEEELKLTENTQPAILTVSVAVYKYLKSLAPNLEPVFVSGHSLGEYTALVISESLSFIDALKVVRARGKYMQEAVPVGEGAMAAVLGADDSVVEEVCQIVTKDYSYVTPANYNSPGQIVISGKTEGVTKAVEILKSKGIRKIVILPVSAPFHSALMEPAAIKLRENFKNVKINKPKFLAISNVTGKPYENENEISELLVEQIMKPVQWVKCVKFMYDNGIRNFVEIGPGKVLSGLIKRICDDVEVSSIEHPEEINVFVEKISKES